MKMAGLFAVMQGRGIVRATPPVEVYRNPAGRFVGTLIGNPPMNILPALRAPGGGARISGVSNSVKLNDKRT
jgi:multiple sugar transport system ATP-binding protein